MNAPTSSAIAVFTTPLARPRGFPRDTGLACDVGALLFEGIWTVFPRNYLENGVQHRFRQPHFATIVFCVGLHCSTVDENFDNVLKAHLSFSFRRDRRAVNVATAPLVQGRGALRTLCPVEFCHEPRRECSITCVVLPGSVGHRGLGPKQATCQSTGPADDRSIFARSRGVTAGPVARRSDRARGVLPPA